MILLKAAGMAVLGLVVVISGFTTVLSPRWVPPQVNLDAAVCDSSVSPGGFKLDAEATTNAGIVIDIVRGQNLPPRAAVIAMATAIQESGLHNVKHGDAAGPDSRGLFQQRASWGPESVRMDPAGATKLFLAALVKVPAWDVLPLGVAAQAVQRSADPLGRWYQQHEAEATAIVDSYKPAGCSVPASGPGQPGNPLVPCKPPITQGYGPTTFTVEPAAHGFPHFHGGKDLACPEGTTVRNIEYAGKAHVTISNQGYGNHVDVEIQAPSGHYWARYAHLATVAVQDGQTVNVGEILGTEGSTGASTGPHLHFGVYQNGTTENDTIDPSGWLAL